jgi:y4mF family transcriptional regulator
MKKEQNNISRFVKKERKLSKLTQKELALKAGVGLRFIRDLEQGKTSLRTDTVNKVLRLFGRTLGPVDLKINNDLNEKE